MASPWFFNFTTAKKRGNRAVEMSTKPELVEGLEDELDIIVHKARHSGMNYWEILKVFLKRCSTLAMQSESEYLQHIS